MTSPLLRRHKQDEQLSGQLATLQSRLYEDDLALQQLLRERETGLAVLTSQRKDEWENLRNAQKLELDNAKLEERTCLEQLDREIAPQRDLVDSLAKNHGQAQIARAQQGSLDIKLAAPAVKPDQPMPRGALNKALVAAVLGGMAGLFIALLRTINKRLDATP